MSTAIAQSATQLTVSNGSNPDWTSLQFDDSARKCAERQAKGVTRERHMLNRQKLISMVCSDYRNHFASLYGKTERLPSAVFEMVEKAVDKHIASKLAEVNATNVLTYRRSFYHDSKQMQITERVAVTGENKLTLKEQLLGVHMFINQANKRLKDLEAKPTPDLDREKAVKEQIMRLTVTEQFINGEIAHQSQAVADSKK